MKLVKRPRRLRTSPVLRKMVRETRIDPSSLIYPIFVKEGENTKEEIPSMPGQYRYSPDRLEEALEQVSDSGVCSVMLFGIPKEKDEFGSSAWSPEGGVQKALEIGKKNYPNLYFITDVCLCEYTSHGHCGMLNDGRVDNDKTLPLLAKTALSHVQAGADMVAPSDMMDGRIGEIRRLLDEHHYEEIPILSYAVKYASEFYGPFREAAGSAPSFGDRKGYQMDYHNSKEGIKEALLDVEEGADIIMIKPALSYLDRIKDISSQILLPTAAYSVSGEYAMIKAASAAGYIKEEAMICETAVSIYRAGADLLLTYYAKELAKFMKEGRIG